MLDKEKNYKKKKKKEYLKSQKSFMWNTKNFPQYFTGFLLDTSFETNALWVFSKESFVYFRAAVKVDLWTATSGFR